MILTKKRQAQNNPKKINSKNSKRFLMHKMKLNKNSLSKLKTAKKKKI